MSDPAGELGARIGEAVADDEPPWYEFATVDTVRHFARSYGDDNPRWSDVAPPLFPIASGVPLGAGTLDVDAVVGSRPAGVVTDRWVLPRPVPLGSRLARTTTLAAVDPQADGRLHVTVRRDYRVGGVLHAVHLRTRAYGLGDSAAPPPRATYRPSELDAIDRERAAWRRRGAEAPADTELRAETRIGPLVKGPLTLTDLVAYRAGVGPGPLGAAALELAHHHRLAHPDLYAADESGVPDTIERRHWDEAYARALGHPTVWDYSHTRLAWATQLLTDWAGDAGWLLDVTWSAPAPAYAGDTHWMEGRVASSSTDDGVHTVDVALTGTNQRGAVTCSGVATVALGGDGPAVARMATDRLPSP